MGLIKTLFAPRDLQQRQQNNAMNNADYRSQLFSTQDVAGLTSQLDQAHLWQAPQRQQLQHHIQFTNAQSKQGESKAPLYRQELQKNALETAPIERPRRNNNPRPSPSPSPQKQSPEKRANSPASLSNGSPVNATPKPGQCHGTTSAGRRCTRIVGGRAANSPNKRRARSASPAVDMEPINEQTFVQLNRMLSRRGRRRTNDSSPQRPIVAHDLDSDSEEDAVDAITLELPRFCHQHAKQAMEEPGTYAGARGVWILFDEWIPADLPNETKLQLRHEMAKPASSAEVRGYIYCHEMIGRSVQPVARLSQWRKQCPNRQVVVRDLFPLHPSHPLLRRRTQFNYSQSLNQPALTPSHSGSRLSGALLVADQGAPFHHRLERLILIEVAGRAAMQASARELKDGISASERGKCSDCGQTHVELFEVEVGAYENWIVDVILRWQMWVEKVLDA